MAPTPRLPTLTPKDRAQLRSFGIPLRSVREQWTALHEPLKPWKLLSPCTVGDGIERLTPAVEARGRRLYRAARLAGRLSAFIPASGAATRMLQLGEEDWKRVRRSFERLPFADDLNRRWSEAGVDLAELFGHAAISRFALAVQSALGDLPKALIPFHRSRSGPRSAFESLLREGEAYLSDKGGRCRFHFTVAPEQLPLFEALAAALRPRLKKELGLRAEVRFSTQDKSTSALAVDDGRLARDPEGRLLLRPSGHGALLANLEACGGDIVFIQNVDNAPPEAQREADGRWKRALAGRLLELQAKAKTLAEALERQRPGSLRDAWTFLVEELGQPAPAGCAVWPASRQRQWALGALDRPLRVCGVVRNRGQVGGAPFWVRHAPAQRSRQIVEQAQVRLQDAQQARIFASATHFNPVLLVCALKDRRGRRHRLAPLCDPNAVLEVRKTHHGRTVRSLERPGLWNGSMALWNSVFVEVPASTFHPVKTLADLLRPPHAS